MAKCIELQLTCFKMANIFLYAPWQNVFHEITLKDISLHLQGGGGHLKKWPALWGGLPNQISLRAPKRLKFCLNMPVLNINLEVLPGTKS